METEPAWVKAKRDEDQRFSRGVRAAWWRTILFPLGLYLSVLAIKIGLGAVSLLNFVAAIVVVVAWRKRRLTCGWLGVVIGVLIFQLSIALKSEDEAFANAPILLLSLGVFVIALPWNRPINAAKS